MDSQVVLVTGAAGYIGSLLSQRLVEDGYEVIAYDKCLFGTEPVEPLLDDERFTLIRDDVSNTSMLADAVERADDVVHLAAIVGDPACSENIDDAVRTNLNATVQLKKLCVDAAIDKFVFNSTCSVYGDMDENHITEVSRIAPLSVYSQTKRLSEESLLNGGDAFDATVLRLATVYGLTPRPRFDLSINYLTKEAVLNGSGTIFGGDQWRPFVHTSDVVQAIMTVLNADTDVVAGQVYNVGSTEENYQMKEIGKILDDVIPQAKIEVDSSMVDERSYKVSFDKIEKDLGFDVGVTIPEGIERMRDAVRSGGIKDPDDPTHYNYTPKEE